LSIVTPTLNEAENVLELADRIRHACTSIGIDYEHLIIDNDSTDGTRKLLLELASNDARVKVIFNNSNFGHIRSPYHGLLQAHGDAVILLASDLQDPPELIPDLIDRWGAGASIVFLVKRSSGESRLISLFRKAYYRILGRATKVPLIPDATGAGLYDRSVVEVLRSVDDPYPYLRGLVVELGYRVETVPFEQPARRVGKSKNGIAELYDMAMLGFTTYSRTPLRLMSATGFILAAVSALIGGVYLVRKLISWDSFDLGLAPIAVGLFFLGAIQLLCLGILGEYIGNIFMHVRRHPLVIERERINFTPKPDNQESS
jgi:glycosyltransferase involved in cell wall biosynthesis